MTYPKASATDDAVSASPRFPEIEERVLNYWAADDTFRASVENRPAGADGYTSYAADVCDDSRATG